MEGGLTQLLNAEAAAEEIVRQGKSDVEQILVQARIRADTIRKSYGEAQSEAESAQITEQVKRETRLYLEGVEHKIGQMRRKAEVREEEAARLLVAKLFGDQ